MYIYTYAYICVWRRAAGATTPCHLVGLTRGLTQSVTIYIYISAGRRAVEAIAPRVNPCASCVATASPSSNLSTADSTCRNPIGRAEGDASHI